MTWLILAAVLGVVALVVVIRWPRAERCAECRRPLDGRSCLLEPGHRVHRACCIWCSPSQVRA